MLGMRDAIFRLRVEHERNRNAVFNGHLEYVGVKEELFRGSQKKGGHIYSLLRPDRRPSKKCEHSATTHAANCKAKIM